MKTQTVLGTDASFFLHNLFKDLLVLGRLAFLEDHIDVDVSISNVPISHHFRLDGPPEFCNKLSPLLYIKGEIIGNNLSAHFGSNGHILPYFPHLLELVFIAGHYSIVELCQHIEEIMKFLCGCLNKKKVLMRFDFIKNRRMKILSNCPVGYLIHTFKSIQLLSQ